MKRTKISLLVISALILGVDLWTKHLSYIHFSDGSELVMIPNFLSFVFLKNTGAAWSMLEGARWLFVGLTLVIIWYVLKLFKEETNIWKLITYSILLAGAAGNLIDRAFLGYVRDMIKVLIFGYHFPVFNVADMAVFIAIAGYMVITVIEEKQGGKLNG